MTRIIAAVLATLCAYGASSLGPKSGHFSSVSAASELSSSKAEQRPRADRAVGVARDHNGKILRSRQVVREFRRITGCGKGFYVDHIVPRACNGPDTISNLQCLSEAQWRAKSTWERKQPGCPGVKP